jgi:hypothetical protein
VCAHTRAGGVATIYGLFHGMIHQLEVEGRVLSDAEITARVNQLRATYAC